MLLALFVFCLFFEIIVYYITKYVTEPPTKMMTRRLEAVDQIYSSLLDQKKFLVKVGNYEIRHTV